MPTNENKFRIPISTHSELTEATDKTEFIHWLMAESVISLLDHGDINRIVNRWVEHKIAASARKGGEL